MTLESTKFSYTYEQLKELVRDANRYRCLRDWCPWSGKGGPSIMQPIYDNGTFLHNELLVGDAADSAIDAILNPDAETASAQAAGSTQTGERGGV